MNAKIHVIGWDVATSHSMRMHALPGEAGEAHVAGGCADGAARKLYEFVQHHGLLAIVKLLMGRGSQVEGVWAGGTVGHRWRCWDGWSV